MDEVYPSESKLKNFLKTLRMNESTISMVLGAMVVVVVGILVYNYFSSVNKVETDQLAEGVALVEEGGELVPDQLPVTHTVAVGEHLWSIAERYYDTGYNWVDIASENNLVNANSITEGQELSIPRVGVKVVEKPEVAGAVTSTEESILNDQYTVNKGDYLWDIAVRAYGDGFQWTKIWEANKETIINPDVVEAGMVLKLPR